MSIKRGLRKIISFLLIAVFLLNTIVLDVAEAGTNYFSDSKYYKTEDKLVSSGFKIQKKSSYIKYYKTDTYRKYYTGSRSKRKRKYTYNRYEYYFYSDKVIYREYSVKKNKRRKRYETYRKVYKKYSLKEETIANGPSSTLPQRLGEIDYSDETVVKNLRKKQEGGKYYKTEDEIKNDKDYVLKKGKYVKTKRYRRKRGRYKYYDEKEYQFSNGVLRKYVERDDYYRKSGKRKVDEEREVEFYSNGLVKSYEKSRKGERDHIYDYDSRGRISYEKGYRNGDADYRKKYRYDDYGNVTTSYKNYKSKKSKETTEPSDPRLKNLKTKYYVEFNGKIYPTNNKNWRPAGYYEAQKKKEVHEVRINRNTGEVTSYNKDGDVVAKRVDNDIKKKKEEEDRLKEEKKKQEEKERKEKEKRKAEEEKKKREQQIKDELKKVEEEYKKSLENLKTQNKSLVSNANSKGALEGAADGSKDATQDIIDIDFSFIETGKGLIKFVAKDVLYNSFIAYEYHYWNMISKVDDSKVTEYILSDLEKRVIKTGGELSEDLNVFIDSCEEVKYVYDNIDAIVSELVTKEYNEEYWYSYFGSYLGVTGSAAVAYTSITKDRSKLDDFFKKVKSRLNKKLTPIKSLIENKKGGVKMGGGSSSSDGNNLHTSGNLNLPTYLQLKNILIGSDKRYDNILGIVDKTDWSDSKRRRFLDRLYTMDIIIKDIDEPTLDTTLKELYLANPNKYINNFEKGGKYNLVTYNINADKPVVGILEYKNGKFIGKFDNGVDFLKDKDGYYVNYIVKDGKLAFGRRHMFLSEGENVDYAGMMYFSDDLSSVKKWDAGSGHYQPNQNDLEGRKKVEKAFKEQFGFELKNFEELK